MKDDKDRLNMTWNEYLEFVKLRLKKTDFQAMQKLKRIDEMTTIVLHAREDYRKKLKNEDIQ